jgi:hypothetical protein
MGRDMCRSVTAIVIAGALALALAGCGSSASRGVASPRVVVAQADELLPAETAEDWRIYADHLVRVRVPKIIEGEVSKEDLAAGEGYIPRVISFQIMDVLWTRTGAIAAPKDMTLEIDGWTFHGDEKTPLRFDGEPMIVADHEYVMPIVYLDKDQLVDIPGWSNLSVTAIIPATGDKLGSGDAIVGGNRNRSDVVTELWGRSGVDAARVLASTETPAYAKPFMDLPPMTRLRHVRGAQRPKGQPGPGES